MKWLPLQLRSGLLNRLLQQFLEEIYQEWYSPLIPTTKEYLWYFQKRLQHELQDVPVAQGISFEVDGPRIQYQNLIVNRGGMFRYHWKEPLYDAIREPLPTPTYDYATIQEQLDG